MKTTGQTYLKRTALIILIAVIISTVYFIFAHTYAKSTPTDVIIVHASEFVNRVSVSGKVIPKEIVDLGFDQSGRISAVYVKVGDKIPAGSVLAAIDDSDLRAELKLKKANLEREKAKLSSLETGTRAEELTLYRQKYSDASRALYVAMRAAYSQTEDAILNKSDIVFTNASTANPILNFALDSNLKRSIEFERIALSDALNEWKKQLSAGYSSEKLNDLREVVANTMLQVKTFLNTLGSHVGNLNGSGLSQQTIDSYRSSVIDASKTLDSAMAAEQAADAAWSSARDTLTLYESGTTENDIAAQYAQVDAAQADVENTVAKLAKTTIKSPFGGIITRMDAKIGSTISPNSALITMMDEKFEVETFIPEINIALIKISDPALITFDAYGSDVEFPAKVSFINPSETVRDGVSMYKVKLEFDSPDERIKSGLTANVVITTDSKPGVLILPKGVIISENGQKYVKIRELEEIRKIPIVTGKMTALGLVEITSGLTEGAAVVLDPGTKE